MSALSAFPTGCVRTIIFDSASERLRTSMSVEVWKGMGTKGTGLEVLKSWKWMFVLKKKTGASKFEGFMRVLALQRFLFAVCCRNPYGSVTDPDRLWYQFVQFLSCIWAMPSRSLQQNFWKSQVNLRRSKVWPFLTMVETRSFVTRIDRLSSPELSPVMLRIYLSTCYHIFIYIIYFPPWILLCQFVRSSFLSVSFIFFFRVSGRFLFRGCDGQRCGTMYFTEHQCHFTWNISIFGIEALNTSEYLAEKKGADFILKLQNVVGRSVQ